MRPLFWSALVIGFSLLLISAGGQEEIKTKIVIEHNKYRKQHHAPALTRNESLDKIAQEWANELLSSRKFRHRPNSKLGENLWSGSSLKMSDMMVRAGANPVLSWYSEKSSYPSNDFLKYGHFTQLVWKSTKYIGVGIAGKDGDVIYVVCNYDPPGNVKGTFNENVLPEEESFSNNIGPGDEEASSTSYWMYGLAFAVLLIVLVFLAILIYYQKS